MGLNVHKIKVFKNFLGPFVVRNLYFAFLLAFLWFAVEASFVFVIQGFLVALGVTQALPGSKWVLFPSEPLWAFLGLLIYGGLRALVHYLKILNADSAHCVFIRNQKTSILRLGLENAERLDEHKLVDTFNERVAKAGEFVRLVFSLIDSSVTSTLLIVAALWYAPVELMIGLVSLAIVAIPFNKLHKTFSTYGEGLISASSKTSMSLTNGIRNNFLLKTYDRLGAEIEKGIQTIHMYSRTLLRYQLLNGLKQIVPSFFAILILCVLALYSTGYRETPAEVFLGFFYLFLRIAQNLSYANNAVSSIQLTWPSFLDIKNWLDSMPYSEKISTGSSSNNQVYKPSDGVVLEAQNISMSFEPGTTLFTNISFRIQDADCLLIKGPSGAGKSTLLSLIVGLQKPSSGQIVMDGMNVFRERKQIAHLFGYVGPTTVLISGSVRENLLFGHHSKFIPTEDELWKALEFARISERILQLPQKLDTSISDTFGFSTGEKQRLAIARAFVRKPKILIFDEATSNVDYETETIIIDEILNLPDKTLKIFVTHRSSLELSNAVHIQL